MSAFTALKNVLIHHHALCLDKEPPQVKALCFGILREKETLDFILAQFLKKPLSLEQEGNLALVLYIGTYQLLRVDTKPYAAIFETVELAKQHHLPPTLVNAVLRNIDRKRECLLASVSEEASYNHPAWLLKLIKTTYPQDWRAIVQENNAHPPFYLRVNQRKISPADYLALLKNEGIIAEQKALRAESEAIWVTKALPITDVPGFHEGFVSVQDIAAQCAPYLLDLIPGAKVLDACAAPGGKACHMLEVADIELTCIDHKQARLTSIQENLDRLGLKAHLQLGDSRTHPFPAGHFDRILLDAPCSGTGVIRRHPDIRYLKSEADLPALSATQLNLLTHLWPALKPGGLLLYATCSILNEENDEVISRFLTDHPDASTLPLHFDQGHASHFGWQFLPKHQGPDGFYYAQLQKKTPPPFHKNRLTQMISKQGCQANSS